MVVEVRIIIEIGAIRQRCERITLPQGHDDGEDLPIRLLVGDGYSNQDLDGLRIRLQREGLDFEVIMDFDRSRTSR